MPELAGDCPKISLGEFFLDASVPNGPNYNTPELIGDLKKLTGPNAPRVNAQSLMFLVSAIHSGNCLSYLVISSQYPKIHCNSLVSILN